MNSKTKIRWFGMPAVMVALLVLLVAYVLTAAGYVVYKIVEDLPFTWWTFFMLVSGAAALNTALMFAVWQNRRQVSPRLAIFILGWGSVAVWYWLFAPLYQFMTLTLNAAQLRIDALAFLLGVPFFGVIGVLVSHMRFSAVGRYWQTKRTHDPAKLYAHVARYPMQIAVWTVVFTVAGFAAGAGLIYYFADLPRTEMYKDIANGVVLSFFLAVYHYLLYDAYLGQIRARLRKQYKLTVPMRRFGRKLYVSILFVMLGSLSLVTLIFVQSYQVSIKKTLSTQTVLRMEQVLEREGPLNTEMELGEHGAAWVQADDATLPLGVSTATQRAFLSSTQGELIDSVGREKIIVYRPYGDQQKFVALVELHDYYTYLGQSSISILVGFGTLAALFFVAALVISRIITTTITRLTRAVLAAQKGETYKSPAIDSGDEFEELAEAFDLFIRRLQSRTDELHREQAKLQASINGLRLGFVLVGTDGQVLMANKTAGIYLHISELEGKKLDELPGVNLTKIVKSVERRKGYASTETELEGRILRLLGSPILLDTEYIGAVLVIEDITEAKIAERSRDEFFSIASHELRTPLTAIRGNAAMIRNYFSEKVNDKMFDEMAGDIHDSSTRLVEIVNDFLDVSRLELGKMQYSLETFALDRVIEKVIYDMSANCKLKGVNLEFKQMKLQDLPDVYADKSRTQQILYNLLGNALKFTAKDGSITVSMSVNGKHLKVLVEDTGIGMSKDVQEQLFRKFQQAGKSAYTRNAAGGTGLGLYISKLLAEQMHGDVKLESSEQGKGSTFSFTLPLAKK